MVTNLARLRISVIVRFIDTSMIPLDKRKPNKNEISNSRPASVLNTFSKLYEKVIKKQLDLWRSIFHLWYLLTEQITIQKMLLFDYLIVMEQWPSG